MAALPPRLRSKRPSETQSAPSVAPQRPANTHLPTRGLELCLSESESGTLPLRIARAIAREIQRGRLIGGDRLPGTRTLARQLGVHRNTVVAAYEQLTLGGWAEPRAGSGHRVCSGSVQPKRKASPSRSMGFSVSHMRSGGERACTFPLSDVRVDLSSAPIEALGRAYRRVLARHSRSTWEKTYPTGHPRLREAVATLLAQERGIAVRPSQVMITRGSQMAIDLCASLHASGGARIALEELSYVPARRCFEQHGAELLPIPLDFDGMRVDRLAQLCKEARVSGVYVTPHHQYPTAVPMLASRKLHLLELAQRYRFPIFEDDYAHEYQFEGKPRLPLAALDEAGVVLYLGTFSKILSPAIRVGYVVGPTPWIERATQIRALRDGSGDVPTELAVAELLEDGEIMRHARRMRNVYQQRRDALLEALRVHLSGVLAAETPSGGLSLWASVARGVPLKALAQRAQEEELGFRTGGYYAVDGKARRALRLQFATPDASTIVENVKRLAQLL